MRSRARATWLAIAVLACYAGVIAAFSWPSTAAAAPEEEEILDALEQVRADPNISPETTMRTLEWLDDGEKPKPREPVPWLRGLFEWIAGASRVVLWTGIIVVLGLLGLFLMRVFRGAQRGTVTRAPSDAPTHVQEMDIRPESLPDKIGGAALELWQRGDHRAALALLYRGLLSRLVHAHGVPIRESTTEADCLRLAVPRLHSEIAQYTSTLVRVWQHAVYGAREPAADEVRNLCALFDRNFPLTAAPSRGHS
ncbi:MAG TPA: DUF4129 domain-containing protein [Steroidobacter sp.]